MDSTSCGYAEKDGKVITGEIVGTDSAHSAQRLTATAG
jgi:hypothetical protein